jgi:phage baseplate assembly protein W
MAFGAVQIQPNDLRPRVGIGCNLPFDGPGVFVPNYTTREAIKNNLINYFLTNPGERPGNPTFGGGLREFIFSSISTDNIDYLLDDIGSKLQSEFPNVIVNDLKVDGNTNDIDNNTITVQLFYSIRNTNISDDLNLSFA